MIWLSAAPAAEPQAVTVSPWLTALVAIVLVALVIGIYLVLRSIDRRNE